MKKNKYIILLIGVLLTSVSSAKKVDRQVVAKNTFVSAVNQGADSALFLGKKLILELEQENSNHKLLPRVYLSLGNFYLDRDRLPDALTLYKKALDVAEQNNDSLYIAFANGSIGNVYFKSKRYDEALTVFKQNLEIWLQKQEKELITIALTNIGKCLYQLGALKEGIDTLQKGMQLCESYQINTKKAELAYYISKIYLNQNNKTEALYWANKSREEVLENDLLQTYKTALLLAETNMLFSNWNIADSLCKWTYTSLKNETKYREEFLSSCNCLVKTSHGLGNDEKALFYKWEFVNQKDTLSKLYQLNQLDQIELEHELHKNLVMDSIALANKTQQIEYKQQLDKDKFKLFNWLAIIICLIVIATGVYIYKSYQKQKVTFKQLAAINKEITDSINYAKHIQDAFLPDEGELKKLFSDSFLYYKPKDIVAGDFYWFDKQEDKILIAVADCSGNGVPGAMISVVCYGALHEAVRQLGLNDTAAILNLTQQLVAKRFELENEKMKDGMDIALCVIDSTTKKIQFSGANNSMLLVRSEELIELKGNKQTIGNIDNVKPFTAQQIQGQKDDAIYLFSDGYVNQLGGDKGKKLKSNSLKKELIKLSNLTMEEQSEHLKTNFENWKSDYEQVDDVCAVGIKL